MVRFATPIAVLALSLGAPSGALAASDGGDSLLSGYGGPGGGEQVLLGGGLTGGGSGVRGQTARGGGGATADPQRAPLAAPTGQGSGTSAPAPAGSPQAPATRPTASRSARHGDGHRRPSSISTPPAGTTAKAPATPTPAAARPVERTGDDAGSPISGRDLGILALVLLGLGALAAATRALVLNAADEAGAARLSGAAARMARTRAAARNR